MTGTPLEEARKAVDRGWYIFPIKANQKAPPLLKDWENRASNDALQIEEWAAKYPDCNWGVACGPSNLTVIDVDPKNGGDETYDNLRSEPGTKFTPTRVVLTQSGGRHLVYLGRTPKSSAHKLGRGIDTRSTGGYIVLAGSRTDTGEYRWKNDLEISALPEWIRGSLATTKDRSPERDTPACELDDPLAISKAVSFLRDRARIDITGYEVACRVRDLGISEDTCFVLMWEHYAFRCEEPWEPDVLRQKVENAYKYAKDQAGNLSPVLIKEGFEDLGPEEESQPRKTPAEWMGDLDFENIPKRQWQLGRRFLKGFITLTISPGGQGKSTLTMTEAAAIASGRSLTGEPVIERGRVWIINTEDPIDELKRRIAAIAILHQLSKEDLENICITAKRVLLVEETKTGPKMNEKLMNGMVGFARENGITHIIIDPFVRCHAVNENDNVAIDLVAQCFSRIAKEAECSISLVHHTRKKNGSSGAGDMDTARGASSLISAARIAHTLITMTDAEATKAKVPGRAKWFVRLDDAKANLSPPSEETKWFEKVSVLLPNGDRVGAIKPAEITEQAMLDDADKEIVNAVFRYWIKPISCHAMAQEMIKHNTDPERQWKFSTLKVRIIELFSGVRRHKDGRTLTAILTDGQKSKANILVEVENDEATEATGSNGDAF